MRKNYKYSADIDNPNQLLEPTNMVFGALTGTQDKVVGVLQLANKDRITELDKQKITGLLSLIGVGVEGVTDIMESMKIVI